MPTGKAKKRGFQPNKKTKKDKNTKKWTLWVDAPAGAV